MRRPRWADRESRRWLRFFEANALFLALFLFAVMILSAIAASGPISSFVDDNCRELVQLGPRSWFSALGCDKYYGGAVSYGTSEVDFAAQVRSERMR